MSNKKLIKNDHEDNSITISNSDEFKCGVPKTAIFIGFQYITTNKSYNFEYFKKSRDKVEAYDEFIKYLQRLSNYSWETISNLGKRNGGFETIEYSNFNSSIANKLPSNKNISKDTKLFVFRFGHNDDYRMVCFKSNSCYAAMHLLGFDFDYSLYDHGS